MMSSSVKKGFTCLFNRILFTSRLVHTLSDKFGPPPILPQRRVVVTGLGLVTPLGCGVETSWENVVGGKCGIRALTFEDIAMESFKEEAMKSAYDLLSSKVVASVPYGTSPGQFDSDRWLDLKNERYMARFISYALCATEEALIDSNWLVEDSEEKENTGVAVGGGIGSIRDILEATNLISEQSLRRLSPFFIPRILINMAAGHVSMKYGFKGPNHAAVTACATGAHSIGDAFKMIRFGDADVMVAGGTESSIDALSIAGFCRAKALSTKFNASPEKSSRPFDRSRDGFVIGEGAGTMVLEELDHAKKRNAKIYAEVQGYGMSGDAYHITKPSDDGHGALLAMSRALKQAGLSPSQVDYINAHATSTPIGDSVEAKAIKSLFGDHSLSGKLAISSTKGATGHLLGAAGAVEAIFAVLALYHDIAPLTLNLEHADPVFHDGFMPLNCSKKMAIHAALTNSFGFGGTNASLAFAKFSSDDGYQA